MGGITMSLYIVEIEYIVNGLVGYKYKVKTLVHAIDKSDAFKSAIKTFKEHFRYLEIDYKIRSLKADEILPPCVIVTENSETITYADYNSDRNDRQNTTG